MAGFLDEGYGEGAAKREKTLKYVVVGALLALLIGTLLYFHFRDFRQGRQVASFLNALRSADYQLAYKVWGCSDSAPCRDYRFEKFLEDWGPKSPHANVAEAGVTTSIGCDTGVISDVRFGSGTPPVLLWAERDSKTLGFFPYHLRPVPDDLRSRTALWLWKLTRNCKPLLE